jgi:hypothetical protein
MQSEKCIAKYWQARDFKILVISIKTLPHTPLEIGKEMSESGIEPPLHQQVTPLRNKPLSHKPI